MRYLVTAEEMRRYDSNTIEKIGIPGMVLMERAALAARDAVLGMLKERMQGEHPNETHTVLILAGVGNNGGDGLALARLLAEEGVSVTVWCVGDEEKASSQWKQQRHILKHYEISFVTEPVSHQYSVLVDALFGVGLSREVTGIYAKAIEQFNSIEGLRLALDMPSGICSDTGKVLGCAVKVDQTVTFGFGKRGLYLHPGCGYAGEIQVADISITENSFLGENPGMFCLDKEDIRCRLPVRLSDGNKGTFGKVLLLAGSEGMAGAAVLSAKAAYRVGAGMVKVLTDESNRIILQETVPEALYGTYTDLEESLVWADVIAIGPGLGKASEAYHALERVIVGSGKPLLIDADGLNLLAEHKKLQKLLSDSTDVGVRKAQSGADADPEKRRQVILTPHVGELAKLTGLSVAQLKENLWEHGMELAEKLHVTVVAKDARTFICETGRPLCMNIHGNSGMATAGSGDVLTGIMAGLWAQNRDCEDGFETACLGVCIHAAAGDMVSDVKGEYGCMAGDMAEAVGAVIKEAFEIC